FDEVLAQPAEAAQSTGLFSWYDHASSPGILNENLHVVNPDPSAAATVHVSIPGCTAPARSIAPQSEAIFGCPSGQGFGGPVTVTTTSGPAVLATQRVQYYQSFNEVASMAPAAASQTLYMPWYDRSSSPGFLNDNLHVVNPAPSGSVSVTVSIPGCSPAPQQVPAGQESIFNCPSGQ